MRRAAAIVTVISLSTACDLPMGDDAVESESSPAPSSSDPSTLEAGRSPASAVMAETVPAGARGGSRWADPLRVSQGPADVPLLAARPAAGTRDPESDELTTQPIDERSDVEGNEPPADSEANWRAAWPGRVRAFHFVTFLYASGERDAPVLGYLRRGTRLVARPLHGALVEVPGGMGRLREGLALEPVRLLGFVPPPADVREVVPYRYSRVLAPWTLVLDRPSASAEAFEALRETVALEASSPDAGVDAGAESPPEGVRDVLRKGFVIVEAARVSEGGAEWVRTLRGGWVPAGDLTAVTPPGARGVVLGGRWRLPLAFVVSGGARQWSWDADAGRLVGPRPVARGQLFPVRSSTMVEQGGRRGYWTEAGTFLEARGVRIAARRPRPEGVSPGARWVHVHLATQTLVAYESDRPRFATVVSTGRAGFETPPGIYRIESKHVSITMDDREEPFLLQEVPWTQFFRDGLALHAAYWHDRFGYPRSHGCVNLAPADARWLFRFTEPALPPGWHGRRVLPGEPSSFVWVEGGDT